jgi:hypothetical protein
MTSDDITPGLNYLLRLRKQMEKSGLPHDDKLYLLVCKSEDAVRRRGNASETGVGMTRSTGAIAAYVIWPSALAIGGVSGVQISHCMLPPAKP